MSSIVGTENDAAIARAIADQEERELMAELQQVGDIGGTSLALSDGFPGSNVDVTNAMSGGTAPSRNTTVTNPYPGIRTGSASGSPDNWNCPAGCGLQHFEVSPFQRVNCNVCGRRLAVGEVVDSCVSCNFDICQQCKTSGNNRNQGSAQQQSRRMGRSLSSASRTSNRTPNNRSANPSNSSPAGSVPPFPFSSPAFMPAPHMCYVPCVIGDGICVEMMVDSGAQLSVISMSLARRLNLHSRMDPTHGMASGVGQARIVGRIRNVVCMLGNVEFDIDFMVLDVNDQLLLLGLDQMRKYKCIIDLEKDQLIFGGSGGVAVDLLQPTQQRMNSLRSALGPQCVVS